MYLINTQKNIGILDMTPFAKCQISGPNATNWLDNIVANRVPQVKGRINLCHALNQNGGVRSEFTILHDFDNSYYLVILDAFYECRSCCEHGWKSNK